MRGSYAPSRTPGPFLPWPGARRAPFLLLLSCLLFVGGARPAAANAYRDAFGDGEWTNGTAACDYESFAYADAYVEVATGELHMICSCTDDGDAWAEATLYKDFAYDHHDWPNHLTGRIEGKGLIQCTGNPEVSLEIDLDLYDITTTPHRLVFHDNVKDEGFHDAETINFGRTAPFTKWLFDGHTYRMELTARIETYGQDIGDEALFDFYSEADGYKIDMVSFVAEHTHTSVIVNNTPEQGEQSGNCAYFQTQRSQNACAAAEGFSFCTGSSDEHANLNGWRAYVEEFSSGTSTREGDKKARIEVTGGNVPRDYDVRFSSQLWLINCESCCNTVWVGEYGWDCTTPPGEGRPEPVSLPAHAWRVLDPVPLPPPATGWGHTFLFTNHEPEAIKVGSLEFETSLEKRDTLSTIEFPGPLYDFPLLPEETWIWEVMTEEPFYDGHIYFSYDIHTADQDSVLAHCWGGHDIVSAADVAEDPAPEPRLILQRSHPNPALGQVRIAFELPRPATVTLGIYDVGGTLVRVLLDEVLCPAGPREVPWDGTDRRGRLVERGVYFSRVTAGGEAASRRIIWVR